jgi:menaquinone-specific isochorismate synthase
MKEQNNIFSKEFLADHLVEQINAALPARNKGQKKLYRFVADVDGTSLLDWLCIQKACPKTYWSSRKKNLQMAGLGAADIIANEASLSLEQALTKIEKNLASAEGAVRYYGSICFDREDPPEEPWNQFGRFYFLVPQFELFKENERYFFAFNVVYEPGSSRDHIIEKMLSSLEGLNFNNECESKSLTASVISRTDSPDKSKWQENILRVIDTMRSENIQKIVLSRKSVFRMSQTIDPIALLKQVSASSINTYDFCFQLDEENTFTGCSPECLYRKDQDNIYSEAIAGTCLAGESIMEQQHFQEKLLNSPKESEEHKYVFDEIKSNLNKICSKTHVLDKRGIIPLRHVQHFCSKLGGILKEEINTQQILETLHPTSAVHGYPKEAAKSQIRKYEDFSRGLYAGPVGWIGKDQAEFAVGIRSALVQNDEISLFAGAGIISSSDPASEWDETENKLRQFVEVISQFEMA